MALCRCLSAVVLICIFKVTKVKFKVSAGSTLVSVIYAYFEHIWSPVEGSRTARFEEGCEAELTRGWQETDKNWQGIDKELTRNWQGTAKVAGHVMN